MLTVRPAEKRDINDVMEILRQGRLAIARLGIDQWQDGYPEVEIIEDDIALSQGWLFEIDGKPAAYCVFQNTPEPFYARLDGEWKSSGPYLTIHRSAVADAFRGRGLGAEIFAFGEELARKQGLVSVRVDTHRGNAVMRHLMEKRGYLYCGEVEYDHCAGDPIRVVYEKCL